MATLHGYEYDKAKAHNSPNGTWYEATYNGSCYFLKKFTWPKYPKEGCSPELYSEMLADSQNWLEQKNKIISALSEIGNGTGNIVSPREVFREKLSFYQTTFWVKSSVESIEDISKLEDNNKIMILQTFASALSKVHNRNIVHGDLKPENIIISRNASNNYVSKIIDFDDSYFSGQVFPPQNTIVTEAYQSPELAAYKRGHTEYHDLITCANDVFAAGIIFHQFWCGEFPKYNGMNDGKFLFEAVSSDEGYEIGDMPSWLAELIKMMLRADLKQRPRMDYVYDCIRKRAILPSALKSTSEKSAIIAPSIESSCDIAEPSILTEAPKIVVDIPTTKPEGSWETIKSEIPGDLTGYTSESLKRLKEELKFATMNQNVLDSEYLKKRIRKAINGLVKMEKGDVKYVVNPTSMAKYTKIEIYDTKVKLYDKTGSTTTLPIVAALSMKLILKNN